MENIKKITNFIFELAGAKTTGRTGWQRIGIKMPESLADHSALSGQIAYVLALMEGADANRAAALSLFHDTAELRLGDASWVVRSYINHEERKEKVNADQLKDLPIKEELSRIFIELKDKKTKEAIIAWDADFLDMAVQAKYYSENGNKKALLWLESIKNSFVTDSAKQLYLLIADIGIEEWWMEMDSIKKKFESLREK